MLEAIKQAIGTSTCKYCSGLIAVRNPTGKCDHLYWPNMLTDEARMANGFAPKNKPSGILWKLNAEEKESLGRVCSMARVYCRQNNIPAQSKEMQDIRQLLGEEK